MEFFSILDFNEIDGSVKDVQITEHGSADDEDSWLNATIISHTQFLPAGDYGFMFDWMAEVHTNEEYFWRLIPEDGYDGPNLPATEFKTERGSGRYYFQYGFPYSWDGGDFNFRLQFKAKDSAGVSDPAPYIRYADFTMTRRS